MDKNTPREAPEVEGAPRVVPELCQNKNTEISVYTFNTQLEPVEAEIDFKCLDTTCDIGRTKIDGFDALLTEKLPQCENGFVIARAEGYETKKEIFSTINKGSINMVLDKKYELDLEILEDLSDADNAIVTFIKEDGKTTTISYPDQKTIKLSEGQYEIKVHIYTTTEIRLQGSSQIKCVSVPKSGFFSLFGATEEKCFNLDIPSQIVDQGVSGGGNQNYYIAESELQNSNILRINARGFGIPSKVEDLQLNYNAIEVSGLDIDFE